MLEGKKRAGSSLPDKIELSYCSLPGIDAGRNLAFVFRDEGKPYVNGVSCKTGRQGHILRR